MSAGSTNTNSTLLNAGVVATAGSVIAISTPQSIGSLYTPNIASGVPGSVILEVQGLRVRGAVNFTAAATGTGVTLKLFQGSTGSGTQVGATLTHTLANNASANIPFDFLDIAPATGVNVYSLLVSALTVAGTANAVVIGVEIASQFEVGSD